MGISAVHQLQHPRVSALKRKVNVFADVLMAVVMGLMFIISSQFPFTKNDPREQSVTVRRESRLTRIFGDNFIVLLSVFLLVSMVMFVLSQFSFQKLLTEMYPDVKDLTNFNSFFVGSVYVISLIMARNGCCTIFFT